MSKVRVFELAKELGLETSAIEEVCKELGIDLPQKHLTHLPSEDVQRVRLHVKEAPRRGAKDTRVDGNSVDLEKEVTAISETELRYDMLSEMTGRFFSGLKNVIREGK